MDNPLESWLVLHTDITESLLTMLEQYGKIEWSDWLRVGSPAHPSLVLRRDIYGYNNKSTLWSDQWASDQGPSGNVFGFFYSTWGINFTLLGNSLATPTAEGGKEEVGNGIYGDYAVCQGPQPYYWGGSWICAAAGTDNIPTVRDVMQQLTCDADIALQITKDTQDYTNCQSAMQSLATDPTYGSDFLGGQNHIALFSEVAPTIDMSNAGPYDQGCNETIQNCFHDYFNGSIDFDTAKANFEAQIKVKYPELTSVEWPQ